MQNQNKYHDYSKAEPGSVVDAPPLVDVGRARTGGTFPVRLHDMLHQLEEQNLSHIASWQPHGRCFMVHRQDDFVQTILP